MLWGQRDRVDPKIYCSARRVALTLSGDLILLNAYHSVSNANDPSERHALSETNVCWLSYSAPLSDNEALVYSSCFFTRSGPTYLSVGVPPTNEGNTQQWRARGFPWLLRCARGHCERDQRPRCGSQHDSAGYKYVTSTSFSFVCPFPPLVLPLTRRLAPLIEL